MSANPAYEQVTLKSVVVQENSAYSIVHTVSPPAAAVAEYENIGDWKHENDELSESTILCVSVIDKYLSAYTAAANSPPQLDEVSQNLNPAYRQVNNIILQENSTYSIVCTVSPPAAAATAEYENIAGLQHTQ